MSWFEHGTSRIHYEESGAGEPVLLLPGWSQSVEQLATLRDALATSYRVIAADLPGSGRSLPQPRQYTASYFHDDAGAFADLLRHLGVGPTRLVGFSDGGEVALLMAATAAEVVRAVAAWGTAGTLRDPDGKLRAVMYNIVDHPIPPMQEFRDSLVATYGEANARAMTQSEVTALGAIIDGPTKGDLALAKAESITCPVLLITGEQDFFVPPALLPQSAARIRGAETVVAEGAGHDIQNSRPDWLADTILGWLKSR
jgi:pimeloyl-ACP methyl ester carboxylesterase